MVGISWPVVILVFAQAVFDGAVGMWILAHHNRHRAQFGPIAKRSGP